MPFCTRAHLSLHSLFWGAGAPAETAHIWPSALVPVLSPQSLWLMTESGVLANDLQRLSATLSTLQPHPSTLPGLWPGQMACSLLTPVSCLFAFAHISPCDVSLLTPSPPLPFYLPDATCCFFKHHSKWPKLLHHLLLQPLVDSEVPIANTLTLPVLSTCFYISLNFFRSRTFIHTSKFNW